MGPPRKPPSPPLTVVEAGTTEPEPPFALRAPGRRLWDAVQRDFLIDDVGGRELLGQMCAAADRLDEISQQIAQDGLLVRYGRGPPKPNALLREELALRGFIVRTMQKLGVGLEPLKAPGRPPSNWSPFA